jgi:hypothetical protein
MNKKKKALELQSPGRCDPTPRNERTIRLSHILGSLSLRRFFRSSSPLTRVDLHRHGMFARPEIEKKNNGNPPKKRRYFPRTNMALIRH